MNNYKSENYTTYQKKKDINNYIRGCRFLVTTKPGIIITITAIIVSLFGIAINNMFALIVLLTVIFLPYLLGNPIKNNLLSLKFNNAGIRNANGEPPIIKHIIDGKKGNKIYVAENCGIAIDTYWDCSAALESALNRHIIGINYGEDNKTIEVETMPASSVIPNRIDWDDKYLESDDRLINLGTSLFGAMIVDFEITPHLLIAGSTGSGKSILLKNALYQCHRHDMKMLIADFKMSEFGSAWRKIATVVTEPEDFNTELVAVIKILEQRKKEFLELDVTNISDYRKVTGKDIKRIIVACDEVAELTDKTGADKARKEQLDRIVAMLSTIARQGRAFGCHAIMSGQRPDSEILKGQIKNNLDLRICGRADTTLSTIVVGDGKAHEVIPKNRPGRFVTNEGLVFQGFYFDDNFLKSTLQFTNNNI